MPSCSLNQSFADSSSNGSSNILRMTSQALPAQPGQCTTVYSLPAQVLEIVAALLAGGHRQNFKLGCKAFSVAVARQAQALDLYQLCGWGDSSQLVPQAAIHALTQYSGVRHVTLPNGWRQNNIHALLNHSELCMIWRQLASLALHFQALNPSSAAALAQVTANITSLRLSLDLAFEKTSRQARRVSSLLQLTQLKSVVLEADLRSEALQVLFGLPRLVDLQLVGSSTSSHSAADLAALCSLTGLTSLRFSWQAGRTLTDASQISNLSNLRSLQIWISAGHHLPPCSSKPLAGLMAVIGALTQLTSLQLLQGLYMSWDLRMIRNLAQLQQLQVLALHDSVLSEFELALLAPCKGLTNLQVDSIKLNSLYNEPQAVPAAPQEEVEFAAGQAAFVAAAAVAGFEDHAPAVNTGTLACHLVTLQRLQHLEVNMLQLGLWQLHELCPDLRTLTPLDCTLGSEGHGVVWELGCLEDHPKLQTLGVMIGALGTASISYNKSVSNSQDAESVAAAIVRVILQSAGNTIRRSLGAGSRCSMQDLLAVLRSLPSLRGVQLWGHAGGMSDSFVASGDAGGRVAYGQHSPVSPCSSSGCQQLRSSSTSRSRSRCSSHGEASSSGCSSSGRSWSVGRLHLSPDDRSIGSGSSSGSSSCCTSPRRSAAAAVGSWFHSLGGLVSPRSRSMPAPLAEAATASAATAGTVAGTPHGALRDDQGQHNSPSGGMYDATGEQQQQQNRLTEGSHDGQAGSGVNSASRHVMCTAASAASPSCCPTCRWSHDHEADHQLVLDLLQRLPRLELIQLVNCEHLAQAGVQLAAHCCSMTSTAVVSVLRR